MLLIYSNFLCEAVLLSYRPAKQVHIVAKLLQTMPEHYEHLNTLLQENNHGEDDPSKHSACLLYSQVLVLLRGVQEGGGEGQAGREWHPPPPPPKRVLIKC